MGIKAVADGVQEQGFFRLHDARQRHDGAVRGAKPVPGGEARRHERRGDGLVEAQLTRHGDRGHADRGEAGLLQVGLHERTGEAGHDLRPQAETRAVAGIAGLGVLGVAHEQGHPGLARRSDHAGPDLDLHHQPVTRRTT